MKHILFICHTISTGGGSEKVLSMLINELSQYYNITLIERLEDVKQPASLPAEVNRLRSMSFTDACLKSLGKNCAVGRIWRFLLSVFIMIIQVWFTENILRVHMTMKYLSIIFILRL